MNDKERHNLQDQFLNTLRKEHLTCAVFLVNGIKLVGRIESFDQYMVLLRGSDQAVQAIFKHAISTVSPMKPLGAGEHREPREPREPRERREPREFRDRPPRRTPEDR